MFLNNVYALNASYDEAFFIVQAAKIGLTITSINTNNYVFLV